MIIKTALNGHAGKLFAHLTRTDDGNERIRLVDIRGCVADDLLRALREMKATAAGSRCEKSLYHVSFAATTDDQSRLAKDAPWLRCAERVEQEFGLEGHARAVVHHFKDNRWHQHVVWNRIDPDTGLAAHLSHERRRVIKIARELEQELKLEQVSSQRPQHRKEQRPPLEWEKESARRTKIDAGLVRDQITMAWGMTRSGTEFAAVLEVNGLILAKGDARPFVVLDADGNFFALSGRVLPGEKARSIGQKLGDVAPQLPSLDEARALLLERERVKRLRRGGGNKGGSAGAAGGGSMPGTTDDPLADRYRAEHVRLKKEHDAALKVVDKDRRAEAKQQPKALAEFDATRPKVGLIGRLADKVTGRARKAQLQWDRKRASLIRAQAKALKAFEARKTEIERSYKREADKLRTAEKQEKAVRAKFLQQAKKAEREAKQPEVKPQVSRPRRGRRLGLDLT